MGGSAVNVPGRSSDATVDATYSALPEQVPAPLEWAPVDSCTLPTAEQPLREAEFGQLFATALRGVQRREPRWLRLRLDPGTEAAARELVARESSCCSFFDFDFASEDGELVLDVRVPRERAAVLDGMARQAQAAHRRAGIGREAPE